MKPSQCEACRAVGPTVMCNLCPTGPRRSVQPPATPQEEQAQTLNDVFDVFETWARRKGATDNSSVSLGFWAFNEFHAIIGQPLRDWMLSRRASAPPAVWQDKTADELRRIAAHIRTPGTVWAEDAIDEIARLLENRARQLSPLPSPPTPGENR